MSLLTEKRHKLKNSIKSFTSGTAPSWMSVPSTMSVPSMMSVPSTIESILLARYPFQSSSRNRFSNNFVQTSNTGAVNLSLPYGSKRLKTSELQEGIQCDSLHPENMSRMTVYPNKSTKVMPLSETEKATMKKLMDTKANIQTSRVHENIIVNDLKKSTSGSNTLIYNTSEGEEIASGGYGKVYKAVLNTGDGHIDCVMKEIPLKNFNITEALIPYVLGEDVSCVPKLYLLKREGDNIKLFMDRALGGSLQLPEETWGIGCIIAFAYSVLCGLSEMHSRHGAHYDIKHSNLGFRTKERDPRYMFIFDYGSYKVDTDPPLKRDIENYTPAYLAPEFKENKEKYHPCDFSKNDTWALGITIKTLFVDGNFLSCESEERVALVAKQLRKMDDKNDPLKHQLVDLLKQMLSKNEQRITTEEALKHQVFDFLRSPSTTAHVKFVNMVKDTTTFEEIVPKGTTMDELLARPGIPDKIKHGKYFSKPSRNGTEVTSIEDDTVYVYFNEYSSIGE